MTPPFQEAMATGKINETADCDTQPGKLDWQRKDGKEVNYREGLDQIRTQSRPGIHPKGQLSGL
jgi:hypothetical protein